MSNNEDVKVESVDGETPHPLVPGLLPPRFQVPALLVMISAGVAVTVAGGAGLIPFYGAFLVVYPGLVFLSLVDVPFLGPRTARFIREWVNDWEKGFYGLMALTVFLRWEADEVLERVAMLRPGGGGWIDALLSWLFDFGVDTFLNLFQAILWPFMLAPEHGVAATLLFGFLCWAVFRIGTRLFSTPAWMLQDD